MQVAREASFDNFHVMKALFCILILLPVCGCTKTTQQARPPLKSVGPSITKAEAKAIRIAQHALSISPGDKSVHYDAVPDGKGWTVIVSRIGYDQSGEPIIIIGTDILIWIDKNGKVTDARQGY